MATSIESNTSQNCRRAFADLLPAEIILRQAKGGLEEYARDLLRANTDFVAATLLRGHLAAAGLLRPAEVKRALGLLGAGSRVSNVEVYACLSTEIWLRRWCGSPI